MSPEILTEESQQKTDSETEGFSRPLLPRSMTEAVLRQLNRTELRQLYFEATGRHASVNTDADTLVGLVVAVQDVFAGADNPVDEARLHAVEVITKDFEFYEPQLPCSGNCFEHDDIQVIECQVQNLVLRSKEIKSALTN